MTWCRPTERRSASLQEIRTTTTASRMSFLSFRDGSRLNVALRAAAGRLIRADMIYVRASTPKDGDRVLQIWRAAVDATHDFLTTEDRLELDKMLQGYLPGAALALAVNESGTVLGFMMVEDGHMEALFIDPAYKGQGVGRYLVEFALMTNPNLSTYVNEQNIQAVGFYTRLGFREIGRSERDGQGKPYPLIHLRHG
jgi:putative acetyltransferase